MRTAARTALLVAALAAVSWIVTGYRFPGDNHAIQLELVRHLTTGGLEHDPFVATLDHYASPLWVLIAWISKALGVPVTLGLLFVATRCLTLYGAARLGAALLDGRATTRGPGWWGGALFATLGPSAILGAGTITARYAEQTSLAVGLWMLAAAWLLERRRWPWAAALGAMALCNSLYALYACVFFVALGWLRWLARDRERDDLVSMARPWLGPVVLAGLAAAPALVAGVSMIDQPVPDAWRELARVRFAHHLQPLTASFWRWIQFLAVFALTHQVAMARRDAAMPDGGPFDWRALDQSFALRLWNAVGLTWVALGIIAGHGGSAPHAFMELQPTRGTDLWVTVAGITLAGTVLERLGNDARLSSTRARIAGIAVLAVAVSLWRFDVRQVVVVAVVAAIVGAVGLVAQGRRVGAGRAPRAAVAGVIAGALVSGLVFKAPLFAAHGPAALVATAEQRYPEAGVAAWARRHLDASAVVVVDPSWDMFRVLSGRSVYTTWKDGAAMLWAPGFATTWSARMKALGLDPLDAPLDAHERREWLEQGYRRVEPGDITEIAAEVDVWIVPTDEVAPDARVPGVRIVRVVRDAAAWRVLEE